jgi:predicted amidophosphoribosyltransferase
MRPPRLGDPAELLRLWPAGVACGRYVPSFEHGHDEHELTQMVRRAKVSRDHDLEFARLLADTVTRQFAGFQPDLVVSVPDRPGREDRFRNIRIELATRLGAADAGRILTQARALEGYRNLGLAQRRVACAGRFAAEAKALRKRVLLVDDVVTSGGQASEAIRALAAAGAIDWRFAAIARATAAPRGDRSGV